MALKVLLGVFLSWVAVGVIGLILAARSPAALRLGESDIRVALVTLRLAAKGKNFDAVEKPMLWAVLGDHSFPARGPNIHRPTRDTVVFKTPVSADSGKWGYAAGRVFIDCTHTDSRGNIWSSY